MTDRELMQQALHTLEGWANHGKWVWPESALEQAKRNTTESIAALRERLAQPEQDWDWRHPKAQALIGAKARLEIKLRLVEQLVEDPNLETTASDMEYWEPLHDKLQERLAQPEQEPVAWVYPEGLEALKSGRPWTAYGSNGDGRIPLYLNDAVALRVEPRLGESGAGFESLPASPNQPEQGPVSFNHDIGSDRFKVVRGAFWWHVLIGDSPTEQGKFRSRASAEKMAADLLREFRNGAFVQHAAPRQWQGLTEEEVRHCYFGSRADFMDYARAIEAKLKERNT